MKPPLSFHAIGLVPAVPSTSTNKPMSWFTPASDVKRSALAEISPVESVHGAALTWRLVASRSFHVWPSLPFKTYCCVLAAERTLLSATAKFWVAHETP